MEALGFRESIDDFKAKDTVVLGVSADPVKKQAKFAEKHSLPFPVLSDADHAVAEAYGVWKPKKFMGREFLGIHRVTFLIDQQGIIRGIFEKIDIPRHPAQVLEAIQALG